MANRPELTDPQLGTPPGSFPRCPNPATRAARPGAGFFFFFAGDRGTLTFFCERETASHGFLFALVPGAHRISVTRTSMTFVCVSPVFSKSPVDSKK